jgi:hypothetical protein
MPFVFAFDEFVSRAIEYPLGLHYLYFPRLLTLFWNPRSMIRKHRASSNLLLSLLSLQLNLLLLLIQIIRQSSKRPLTKQKINLLKRKLLRFLHLISTATSAHQSDSLTLNMNQIVGNVTSRLKATKIK